MQSISLDRLFGHRAPNITAEETFERAVGWRYGIVFGVATVLTGWGYDGWEQFFAPVELAGVKLLLAAITIIPLTILAGALAARTRDSVFRRLVIWFLIGGANPTIIHDCARR